jgi:energy-coupling factor transporter ATP-binding protein EcfA2
MIELKNIQFSYTSEENLSKLKPLNLHIKKGETVLICGESGCGKTTLTRLVNGLIPHYYEGYLAGNTSVCGKQAAETPLYELAKSVGSVFQNPRSQFFNVDTTSELAFGCENLGIDEQEVQKRIERTSKSLSLTLLLDRSIFELSGGEKQKIACGSVGTLEPDIMVLDEPTSNLDVSGINDLQNTILEWKSQGKTILIAEHRLYFLNNLADRVVYMKDGEIIEEYTGTEFYRKPPSFFRDRGLRIPSLNKLKVDAASLHSEDNTTAQHKFTVEQIQFSYTKKENIIDIPKVELPEGGVIAVIGHNGAGKTTFVRSLCGLLKKDKSILKYKENVFKAKKRLDYCYMVMQDVNHQLFTESVLDEVLLSMKKEDTKVAESILDSLDLLSVEEKHPLALSGGQKQRIAVAQALASGRNILVFDEPTSGLDLRHMEKVSRCISELSRQGKTIFIVTHDPEFILSCCTHILHIKRGETCESYPMDDHGKQKMMDYFISGSNYSGFCEERGVL